MRRRSRTLPQAALGTLFLLLAVACCVLFAVDASRRRAALDIVSTIDPEARAAIIETMRLQERADLAGAMAAGEILERLTARPGPVPAAAARQLEAVRDLSLACAGARPGWFYPRFLVGRAAFVLGADVPTIEATRRWTTAARAAAGGAPGNDTVWEWTADRYLEVWGELSSAERDRALPVLRRALLDPGFVAQAFSTVCRLVPEQAGSLLPDEAESLRAALKAVRLGGPESLSPVLEARLEALQPGSVSR